MKKILVIAAHSDDEILGCGGTMAKHSAAGDQVAVIFITDGVGSRVGNYVGSIDVERREAASEKALRIVGADLLAQFSFTDNALDGIPRIELIQEVEKKIDEYAPDVIYTHHGGDLNVDHRRVMEAVMTACRPQPGFKSVSIYSFEVASSTAWQGSSMLTPFIPNMYVDIDEYIDIKLEALRAYKEEMRNYPHVRSIEALHHLARWRGSQVGFKAAEAFVVERKLIK